ncbi:FAD-dependent oxidoreductase [Kaarinaea lacus]
MKVHYLIVGQGLAGSILAWELMQYEQRVLVVDNHRDNSASRVAAGLINPITGQRLVKSTDVDVCLPDAFAYYQRLEKYFKQQFYYPIPMLRLFRSKAERDRYRQRSIDAAYQSYLGADFKPGQSGEPVDDKQGGFAQQQTGYLDIATLLEALRGYFQKHESYCATTFDHEELKKQDAGWRWQDYHADYVIFCEGANALDNPWFRWLPFQLCKGEIITVQSAGAAPQKMINDGNWLLPLNHHTVKIGATYEWQWREEIPGNAALQTLIDAYHRLTGETQYSVVDHKAGIRPSTKDKHPFIGRHPQQKRLAIFNGFGSKGVLLIPYFASLFTQSLLGGKPLPKSADINRLEHGTSMVTLAKRFVSDHIQQGDVVIDATVGNGYDTEFLARCVGVPGHVYGFDIQQQAIANTLQRLVSFGLEGRVTLYHAGHESMAEYINPDLHGDITAVVFNLGYLPGSSKTVQTQMQSTISALNLAIRMLKVGGIISIVCYTGHPGGEHEALAVWNWLQQARDRNLKIELLATSAGVANAPGLIKVIKRSRQQS